LSAGSGAADDATAIMKSAELQVIVLAADAREAAGAATTPWQSAPVNGVPLLPLMLSRAMAVAGHAVTVVLGANARELAPALGRLPVTLVVDRNWQEGAAAPIRAGLLALAGSCSGALLLHAAQSGVTSADLQRLVDLWRRNPRAIVAAQCGGGHELPAIFPRSEFPALLRLRGGQGARALLRSPNATLAGVPMPSALVSVP
jgi:molybdenum cofactor cytidylyltransferase